MGLFFDRPPSQDQVNTLATAYERQPPAPDELDHVANQFLRQFDGIHLNMLTSALRSEPMESQEAQQRAQTAMAHGRARPPAQFKPLRFTFALLIFLCLVGAGIGSDAAHLASAPGALFGFAGSVFGLVTAFLGTEKGS